MPKDLSEKLIRHAFSNQYIESIFYIWYKNRQLGSKRLTMLIPPDEDGVKVSFQMLNHWIEDNNWDARADALDLEAAQKMDITIIDERIRMFKEHAEIGKEIKDFGLTYLRENGIKTDMAALRAIADGIQIERSSRGLADSLARLAELDDTKLLKEINKLLEAGQNTIDVEAEDVTEQEENE